MNEGGEVYTFDLGSICVEGYAVLGAWGSVDSLTCLRTRYTVQASL